MNLSHKTAIKRKGLSAPTEWLRSEGLIKGRILDYGCGRGSDAILLLNTFPLIERYDPYYFPFTPKRKYDTIICNYVLNVIPDVYDRLEVLKGLRGLIKKGGVIYISVRRDKKNLKGYTRSGTWQGLVELDLPVVYEKRGSYIIYRLGK